MYVSILFRTRSNSSHGNFVAINCEFGIFFLVYFRNSIFRSFFGHMFRFAQHYIYNATESSFISLPLLLLLLLLLLPLFAEWLLLDALIGVAFVSGVELLLALLIEFGGCQVLSAGVVASCGASPPYPSSGLSASGPVNCRNLSLLYSASSSSVCSGITSCSRLLLFRMIFLPHELKIGSILTLYPANVDGHCGGSSVDGGGVGVGDVADAIVVAAVVAAAAVAHTIDELLKIPTIGCILSFL